MDNKAVFSGQFPVSRKAMLPILLVDKSYKKMIFVNQRRCHYD